jgi:hypothetical protein
MDAYFQWLREKHVAKGLALPPPMLGPALVGGPHEPGHPDPPAPPGGEEHRLFGRIPFSYLTVIGGMAVGRPWQLYCGLAY